MRERSDRPTGDAGRGPAQLGSSPVLGKSRRRRRRRRTCATRAAPEPHMRRIMGPAPPPPRTTPGETPDHHTPALERLSFPLRGCAWAPGTSEAAGHRRQHAADFGSLTRHSCRGDSASLPASEPLLPCELSPPHTPYPRPALCPGLSEPPFPPHPRPPAPPRNDSSLLLSPAQGRQPHAASPRVLELNEGEGRSPAAVLQVDVADGAVFVKHVLNVLGPDVRR